MRLLAEVYLAGALATSCHARRKKMPKWSGRSSHLHDRGWPCSHRRPGMTRAKPVALVLLSELQRLEAGAAEARPPLASLEVTTNRPLDGVTVLIVQHLSTGMAADHSGRSSSSGNYHLWRSHMQS